MLVDQLRKKVVEDLYTLNKIKPSWPVWREVVTQHVSDFEDPDQVLRIGCRLYDVFSETRQAVPAAQSDQQSELAGGGSAWEALVCWYLNLCLVGTTAVVVKRRKLLAGPITKAISIKYGNVSVNSESDLIAATFPKESPFTGPLGATIEASTRTIDEALRAGALSRTAITIIQCKTNWNDNAQVPMLWDLVYRATSFEHSQIAVGIENFSPRSLRSFKYAFVTVPTSRLEGLTDRSTAVARLRDLSGKNYWGRETKKGVALALQEIFSSAAIGPDSGRGVRESLRTGLKLLRTDYEYFGL
jgi:hypothetical protein